MTILLFVLAHFIGDYVLQNNQIVAWKHRSFTGVVFHTLLVTLAFIVVLWPYLHSSAVLIAIGLNGVLHLAQDQFKVKMIGRFSSSLSAFLFDQAAHLIVAAALAYWVIEVQPNIAADAFIAPLYHSPIVALFFLGVVLLAHAAEIFQYVVRANTIPGLKHQRDWCAMGKRVSIFSVIYIPIALVLGTLQG